jgi:hypothetical protein
MPCKLGAEAQKTQNDDWRYEESSDGDYFELRRWNGNKMLQDLRSHGRSDEGTHDAGKGGLESKRGDETENGGYASDW